MPRKPDESSVECYGHGFLIAARPRGRIREPVILLTRSIPVPDSLSCAVCLLPFRDPHLVSCCGKKYCAPCIGRVKAADQPCPVCKQDFVSLLDRDYQRKVLNLKVVCSKKSDGCQWVDELRHLDHHEREECGWAEVECSYQCGAHLARRLMAEHKREACPQRPVDVKLEWFMKSMETKLTTERERHVREMAAVREEFRNTLTEERETHKKEVEELKQLLAEQKKELKVHNQLLPTALATNITCCDHTSAG